MARIPSVIKASQAGDAHVHMERLVRRSFQLDDVMTLARRTVAEARQEADTLLRTARLEAETILRAAREQGHREGFAQGRSEGAEVGRREAFETATRQFAEQHQSLAASWTTAIEQIEAHRSQWVASARQDLIELAMAIADRVAHCVGQHDRQAVQANLDEAVRLIGRRSEVTVYVHPQDADAARAFAADVANRQDALEHVEVKPCEDLAPGGCRVGWGDGNVDAALDVQLDRIARALHVARCAYSQGAQAGMDDASDLPEDRNSQQAE